MKATPAFYDWVHASERLRLRLRRKRDAETLERLLDELERAVLLAGRDMARDYYRATSAPKSLH